MKETLKEVVRHAREEGTRDAVDWILLTLESKKPIRSFLQRSATSPRRFLRK